MENKECSVQSLLAKATRYCASAEHCTQDVTDKLTQWGADSSQQEDVLLYLVENKYIDDKRYADAFVHDKVHYQKWGIRKIQAALKAKRISDNDIQAAVNVLDRDVYDSNLQYLIKQKKGYQRDNIIRFLLQRGYTMNEILEKLFV